jgi:hypothetical protein
VEIPSRKSLGLNHYKAIALRTTFPARIGRRDGMQTACALRRHRRQQRRRGVRGRKRSGENRECACSVREQGTKPAKTKRKGRAYWKGASPVEEYNYVLMDVKPGSRRSSPSIASVPDRLNRSRRLSYLSEVAGNCRLNRHGTRNPRQLLVSA